MTKPVDLDALDALYAKPHDGTPDDSTTAPEVPWVRRYLNLCAIEKATRDAYPAMAAELRERRAREEAMAAELRALREVAEAARAFLPTCEVTIYQDEHAYQECGAPATHIDRMQGLLCDGHRSAYVLTTPRPLDPDPRVDALRAALDRVPR